MSCFITIYTVTIIAILVTPILLLLLLVIFRRDRRGISERQHKSSARSRRMGQLIKCQSDGQSWDKPGTISESWTTSGRHREMDGSGTRPRPLLQQTQNPPTPHIFKRSIAPSLSLLHWLMQVRKFPGESCLPSHVTDHSRIQWHFYTSKFCKENKEPHWKWQYLRMCFTRYVWTHSRQGFILQKISCHFTQTRHS